MWIRDRSGSGKSTFLRCLNRLEQPSDGQIFFEGEDLTHMPDRQLYSVRQKMGMVFQHFHLFPHLTIQKNITLAPVKLKRMTQAEADAKATELLQKVGLADKANQYPDQLSGGQKQRIAIARACLLYTSIEISPVADGQSVLIVIGDKVKKEKIDAYLQAVNADSEYVSI